MLVVGLASHGLILVPSECDLFSHLCERGPIRITGEISCDIRRYAAVGEGFQDILHEVIEDIAIPDGALLFAVPIGRAVIADGRLPFLIGIDIEDGACLYDVISVAE